MLLTLLNSCSFLLLPVHVYHVAGFLAGNQIGQIGSLWARRQIKNRQLLSGSSCGWFFHYLVVCCIYMYNVLTRLVVANMVDVVLFQKRIPPQHALPKVHSLSEKEVCVVNEKWSRLQNREKTSHITTKFSICWFHFLLFQVVHQVTISGHYFWLMVNVHNFFYVYTCNLCTCFWSTKNLY